jgi:hypothetical protein
LGTVFDIMLGRHIARATMNELLDRVARALERREAEYRASLAAG